jgi:thiol reductant ABC exporter CydC subunit
LLGLIFPFAGWIGLTVLLGAATIGSSVGLMATSAYIISAAALHPSIADLQMAIVGVRAFGIARGVFRYLERYTSHQVTFQLLARWRVWFYQALEPLAPACLLGYRGGDLLSRAIGDIAELENFYVRALAPPLVAVVVALVTAIYMYSFNPSLALTLLAFLLVGGLGVTGLVRWLGKSTGNKLVEARAALSAALVDGIQGMADLLAYGSARQYRGHLVSLGQQYGGIQRRMARLGGFQSALSLLAANLAAWAILVQSIRLVSAGQIAGVYLAVLVLVALTSFEAVAPLPLAAQYLGSNLAAARRLFQIADEQPAARDPIQPAPVPECYELEVDRLRFAYPGGGQAHPALDGVSFSLRPGGKLAVVGPSGAGKTTLVHLLLRFWDYEQGSIRLAGRDLRSYRQDDVRRLVSLVSQDAYLFNATVRENLLIARPDATEADLTQAARQAQIHDFIRSLPDGYDTWVGEQGYKLSGGERQRLAIARALLKDAPLLILDEPTADLDTLTERQVLEALYSLMDARTTLVITHRLVGLEAMDEILVLERGRVVERGRHQELLEVRGLYRRMWELQNQVLEG